MSQPPVDTNPSLPPPLHPPFPPRSSVTFDLLPRGAQPSPMQQCWQVNAWGLQAVAALLPLLVLRSLECVARREQQGPSTAGAQAGSAPSSGQGSRSAAGIARAAADAGVEGSSQPAAGQCFPLLRPPGWWLLEPWLTSALLWRAAGLAAVLLAPAY